MPLNNSVGVALKRLSSPATSSEKGKINARQGTLSKYVLNIASHGRLHKLPGQPALIWISSK